MQCSASPAASSSASTAGHSERVSERISASSSNSPRASMIASRARRRSRTPGCGRPAGPRGEAGRAGRRRRSPRCRCTSIGVAALDDLGVAARIWHARRPRGAGDRVDLGTQLLGRRPSSSTSERLSASGRAPATARSLTVPLTASSPIEPPGKRSGRTTKLSVVIASRAPSRYDRSGVAQRLASAAAEGRDEQPLDQGLRRLAARPVGHRDVLVPEPRALGPRGLDDPEDALLALGDSGARHQTTSRSRAKRP